MVGKKVECEKCKRKVRSRNVIRFKGKTLCSNCRARIMVGPSNPRIDLKKALGRVYKVKGYLNKKGSVNSKIDVPSILTGKKVKLIIQK